MIRNPVLPGFNPDPSICRVGEDYYIATSTFEWYPGVQIHHSRDLVNWRLVKRPLERASQLDMRGNPDSCGIWAPCLSYADGLFWLVYTDVKRIEGSFKDTHNYIVTAPSIDGPWSDPVHVNSSGFDPSLFHDDDGRKWFMNMQWNHLPVAHSTVGGSLSFDGILLQEWDAEANGLKGQIYNIYPGTDRGLVEGPHIFKKNGWYYLTTAEGGTGYDHAVTLARSRAITGPYETHPDKHLLTAMGQADAPLQRTGHGQYFETSDGHPATTFLCGRPLPPARRCTLGRETGIEACVWKEDGWLYPLSGSRLARLDVPELSGAEKVEEPSVIEREFDRSDLPSEFQWLRTPYPERIFSLSERSGYLRLFGRESIGSWFEQALVARRQEHHRFRVETVLEFEPDTYQQAAGLTYYYNRNKFFALAVTVDATLGRCLTIMACAGDLSMRLSYPVGMGIPVPEGPLHLAMDVRDNDLQFHWKAEGAGDWHAIGPELDGGVISDEGGEGEHSSFTGAFAGMFAFDTSGRAKPADFDRFRYEILS